MKSGSKQANKDLRPGSMIRIDKIESTILTISSASFLVLSREGTYKLHSLPLGHLCLHISIYLPHVILRTG
jgi:predicted permease